MKRRKWYLVTMMLVLALVLAACGGEETPAEEPAEAPAAEQAEEAAAEESEPAEVELEGASIKVWFGSVGDEAGSYGQLIEQFEAETGATVEVVSKTCL